jgi:Uma2 family endonuclease
MTVHSPIAAPSDQRVYRFTQRDYMLLAENGAFDQHAKTELIEGVIYAVNAQYSRHARVQTALVRRLADACDAIGEGWAALVEPSIALSERSMPQPDVVVVQHAPDDGPIPSSNVRIVVEVADSTLDNDLGPKAGIYAVANIAEYWVADTGARIIHQFFAPEGGRFTGRAQVSFGEPITSAAFAPLKIETSALD